MTIHRGSSCNPPPTSKPLLSAAVQFHINPVPHPGWRASNCSLTGCDTLQGWGTLSAVREDWLKGLLLRIFAGLWRVFWGAVETPHQLQAGVICATVLY